MGNNVAFGVPYYTLSVLKCGDPSCKTCQPVGLPSEIFNKFHHLPDPMLGEDGHYKLFEEVIGKNTTEDGRRSKKKARDISPFVPIIKHAKNTNLMAQCEECLKRRLYIHDITICPTSYADKQA